MHTYPDIKLFIDGEWRDGVEGKTINVVDPALGETIDKVAHATTADLDLAVNAADKGFKLWRDVSAFERSNVMFGAAGLLRDSFDQNAWLMTREQGKPLAQAKIETLGAADAIEWFAEEARRTYG